jgi:basic membrane protein A
MRKIQALLSTSLLMSFCTISFAAPVHIGLVLDKGGKDDKSFNSAAYEGAIRAQKDLGIELKYVEATDTNAIENLHRAFAKKDLDLIIGVGFAQMDAVKKIAAQFPQKKFAIVDGEVNLPNVKSLLFEEHEGSFVVGALAAMKSTGSKVGFIGGMDIPLIRRFEMGYEAGAKKIKPDTKLISNFIGVSGEAWNNPAKAKELALAQYNSGVDVIFVAAGASGSGVFDAAEEKKKFAIGVDSNQNWIKPGTILTSMLKRVDVAVYDAIKEAKESHFQGGVLRFGLKNKGVDYALDQYNQKLLSPDQKAQLEKIKERIISGKIQAPDFYKKK